MRFARVFGTILGLTVTGHQTTALATQRPSNQHVLDADNSDILAIFAQHRSSYTRGFVALGDSYSAGIGTGVDGKEDECRRGLHAYPALIFADLAAHQKPNSTASFQWMSCTGAVTEDLLSGGVSSQIDSFNTSSPTRPEFALLSIGGNDLGFFDVINACIFRFYSYYSGTCESALAAADARIASDDFERRLRIILLEVLDKVRWEKHPKFTITVTGYAQFFNAETPECDEDSFGVWWGGPKLTSDIRHKMNAMVLAVNKKLQRAVDEVNSRWFTKRPKVLFIDYDREFEGHRFCEPNITEPAYNRTDTWFFLIGGPDNAHNETQWPNVTTSIQTEGVLSPSSALIDPDSCLEGAQTSGDWGELALCFMAMAKQRDPTLQFAKDNFVTENSMWYVPTYYGKTFHPRTLGHEVIRDKIYEEWAKHDLY